MKKILFAVLLLAASVPVAAQNGGVDFSGTVQTAWGVAAPWTDADSAAGRFTLGTTSLTGKLDAWYADSSAYAEGSVSYDATTGSVGFSLSELWIDYSSSAWGIRIGRQKAAWGKADGIDITNVLCPQDMSSFFAMTGDSSSLAVDALRLSLSMSSFTADAYWIPFFTPTKLPLDESNPLRKFLVPSNTALPVTVGTISVPEVALWSGEYGLRLSGYFSALDVSLYGFYGWDDMPIRGYTPSASEITVSGEYRHMAMVGADAAIPVGETVIRAEAAFFPLRAMQKSTDTIVADYMTAQLTGGTYSTYEERNQLSALVGIDWMPSGWTLTAQYYCDVVFGEIESLDRENAFEHGATVSVSKTFLNETLEASVSALVHLNDFDSLISPSISYSLSDQIKAEAGAFLFIPGPQKDGTYGAYKDLSSLYLKATFSF